MCDLNASDPTNPRNAHPLSQAKMSMRKAADQAELPAHTAQAVAAAAFRFRQSSARTPSHPVRTVSAACCARLKACSVIRKFTCASGHRLGPQENRRQRRLEVAEVGARAHYKPEVAAGCNSPSATPCGHSMPCGIPCCAGYYAYRIPCPYGIACRMAFSQAAAGVTITNAAHRRHA